MDAEKIIFVLLFIFWSPACGEPIKIGAVFKTPDDLHLSETFRWAVEWGRKHMYTEAKSASFLDYRIEYVKGRNFEHQVAQKVCKLANDGAIAIFSGSDIRMSRVIRNVADHLNILYFNIVWDHEAEKDALNFFPDPQKFVQAFEDLILYWQWSRVVIVYEDPWALGRLEYLLISEKLNHTKVAVVKVENGDYVNAMRKVKYSGITNILVDAPTKTVREALLAALEVGIISHQYWFLITSLDFYCLDLELFRHNHGRVTGFTIVNNSTVSESPVFGYIQDYLKAESPNSSHANFPATEIALMFDAVYAYARGVDNASRLLFDEDLSQKAHCEPFGKYEPHPVGSSFFNYISHGIARDNGLTGSLKFRGNYREALQLEIYQLGYDGTIDTIGTWNSSGKLVQMDNESAVPYNAEALHVTRVIVPHLRVTTLVEQPYVQLKENHYELQGNDKYEGFCIDLLNILSQDLGFTYTIQRVKDNKYGNKNSSGQWDGLIGEILSNQSDIAVAPLTITYTRAALVDFTTPFLAFGIGVLLRIPQVQRPGLFSFMKPLSGHIWMSILVAALVTIILAYVIARITPYEWRAPRSLCAIRHPREAYYAGQENVLVNNYTLANSAWYVMTTFLKGCAHFAPKSISTRLLGGFWWVFCLVMISAYTANLAAVLTVDRRFLPIKSLEDLAYQNDISFGAIEDGSTAQFFNESKITAHRKMWERMALMRPSVFVVNNSQGVDKVLSENYAFLMESSSLEYLVAKRCNLMAVGAVLGSNGYGIALRKGSRWTDLISRWILNYGEKGKIEQVKTVWWKVRGSSCQQSVSATMKEGRVALNMESVAGLFLILLAGLCLAVLLGILEFIVKNKENADIEQRSIWAEMAHELCLAFRTPRSSRRHQIQRRCSRCDVPASLVLGGQHRSRRISQHPLTENNVNVKSQSAARATGGGGAGAGTGGGAVALVPAITHKHGNHKCGDRQRAHSAGGGVTTTKGPSSPYCVVRHRVDADVIEFHENGKLLDHHETATTMSTLSRCSTQDKLTASCAYGLPTMR